MSFLRALMKEAENRKFLLKRISEDNSGAFSKLFDLYFSRVFQFASYFIKSEEICKEVTSDVFISLWNNRKKLMEILNFDAYLYKITKNKALDYIDKVSRQPKFTPDLPVEIHSYQGSPEDQLLIKELEEAINQSISYLPERCKIIFLMAREEGLTYHEIADILSISEKTVNAQMVTAIRKMGEALKKYMSVIL